MLKRILNLSLALILHTQIVSTARASGFQQNYHSARQSARAGAVIATVDDPSAIFYNPAGITASRGTEFLAGVSVAVPHGQFTNSNQSFGTETNLVLLPHGFVTRQLSDKAFVGFGLYIPYSLRINWSNPEQFIGRELIRSISMDTWYFTPTVGLKLHPDVNVALGISLVPATFSLEQNIGELGAQGTVNFDATAFGISATAGINATLFDTLYLGLTYRSGVDLAFSGDVKYTLSPEASDEIINMFRDDTFISNISLPHSFIVGLGWRGGGFTTELDVQLTTWETIEELNLETSPEGLIPTSAESFRSYPRRWRATVSVYGGAEFLHKSIALRMGGGWTSNPVPDETLDFLSPMSDEIYGAIGLGYDFGFIRFDISYLLRYVQERLNLATNQVGTSPGRFDSGLAHNISVSLGFRL